jgi:hypothetical protein
MAREPQHDHRITAERNRSAGRLLGDATGARDEATAVGELGSDAEDDANLTPEERAMHLTKAPAFDADDGYVEQA